MAIASPTVQVAALAAFNRPGSYIAPALFPRCPIPGAAMKPGDNTFRGTAYRVEKNNNRRLPGELSLEMVPGRRPNRTYSTLEDYSLSAKLYHLDEPVSSHALPTLDRFGIDNYLADVAVPSVMSGLLQDRERRVAALIADTANFGGNSSSSWLDDNIDPIEQLDTALRTMLLGFGEFDPTLHSLQFVLALNAWTAFRNNAKVRARFKITEDTPVMPGEMSTYIGKVLSVGDTVYPVNIRIASASDGGGANEGETFSGSFIIDDVAVLAINGRPSEIPLRTIASAAALQSQAEADLRTRSWGRGYSMLDPTVSTIKPEETSEMITRVEHATTDTIYDATGGYVWTAPAS